MAQNRSIERTFDIWIRWISRPLMSNVMPNDQQAEANKNGQETGES